LPEASFRRSLTVPPLPSASILINMFNILTGFTYRGLSPHKFTPVPGVHKPLDPMSRDCMCLRPSNRSATGQRRD
jgi:hypothetical protein